MGLDAPSSASLCSLFPDSWGSGNAASTIYWFYIPQQISLTCIVSGVSSYIGNKGVMCSRDFWLIQTGQSIMGIGCGYHVRRSFTRHCLFSFRISRSFLAFLSLFFFFLYNWLNPTKALLSIPHMKCFLSEVSLVMLTLVSQSFVMVSVQPHLLPYIFRKEVWSWREVHQAFSPGTER